MTKAHEWADDVPEPEKIRRLETLIARQEAISAEINAAQVGQQFTVMVEGRAKRGNGWWGRTPQFKNAVFDTAREPAVGELVTMRVTSSTAHTLIGEETPAS